MRADNPLTLEFLSRYPIEAARILEQVGAEHAGALFNELPVNSRAAVMTAMLPEKMAACLLSIDSPLAAKLLAELPLASGARVYRQLSTAGKQQLTPFLAKDTLKKIKQFVKYPVNSVGALCITGIDMLPHGMYVNDALRRLEHPGRPVNCEIYVIDETHRLEGTIELGKLMASKPHAKLHEIMTRKTHAISAMVSASTVLNHPGWKKRRRLAVIDRENVLVGALDYNDLKEAVGSSEFSATQDPAQNLFSFASLFWQVMAHLMDSVLNISSNNKGERP